MVKTRRVGGMYGEESFASYLGMRNLLSSRNGLVEEKCNFEDV